MTILCQKILDININKRYGVSWRFFFDNSKDFCYNLLQVVFERGLHGAISIGQIGV